MKIELFNEHHRAAVVALWQTCGLTVPWNDPHRDIDRKIAHSPDQFWVGLQGDSVIATVMFGYDGHRGSVNYLAVALSQRGRGVGRQLMKAVEDRLSGMGCPKLNLSVRRSNHEVLEFYRRLDYQTDDVVNLGRRFVSDE